MSKVIKWGILAPGAIAHKFVKGLSVAEGAQVRAVGSRTLEKAEAFAGEYGIAKAYGSYEELVSDPDVDIIYVATPHPFHRESVLLCLNAGKAVLCEKPFTINAGEAEELVSRAREAKLFLMEAMWTRFLPAIVKVREWLAQGLIGQVRMVKADFGFQSGWNPKGRLLDPKLGGGALLDAGIYPVSFASMVLGTQPDEIRSLAHLGETGVDEQFSLLFGYPEGRIASLSGAVRTNLINDAWIMGTEGHIHVPSFLFARSASLFVKGQESVEYNPVFAGNGYHYEAEEAMRCLREGRLESPVMPLEETLAIMRTLDSIREQWGLRYEGE
ncbi:MAG: dehydrogenase [Paenibacillaceae bacterium]|jgi:predicted dehydrogenase|nr:dehydrogenase [Paenibacillaceae bacterium]